MASEHVIVTWGLGFMQPLLGPQIWNQQFYIWFAMPCWGSRQDSASFLDLSSFTSHLNLFLRVEVQMKTLGEKCFPESTAVLRLQSCIKQRFVHKEFAARVGWGKGRMNRWSQYNTVTAGVRSGQEEKLEEESLTIQQDLRKVPGRDCTGQKPCF